MHQRLSHAQEEDGEVLQWSWAEVFEGCEVLQLVEDDWRRLQCILGKIGGKSWRENIKHFDKWRNTIIEMIFSIKEKII